MLARVFAANYWQPLANCCPNHERVRGAETILVRLGQSKVLKVQTKLANIGRLFDGHLAGVSSVVAARVAWIHEGGLVLACLAAAGELR